MSNNSVVQQDILGFSEWYGQYHGYISLVVCIAGIITNLFNVTVLTRRHMRTPVNQILTALAVSDIITMVSYLPFAIHFYPSRIPPENQESRGWMLFLLFHINITTVTHTISIWLCVVLSIVRYLHIRSPTRASSVRHRRSTQTTYIVLAVYIISIFIMIPNYLTNKIQSQNSTVAGKHNQTIYFLENLRLGSNDTKPLVLANVWMYSLIAKIVPCFLMSFFGSLLLYQMRAKIKQRKDFLKISASNNNKLHEHSRTTKMLITVILLFLLTELPQGILIILSACRAGFFASVYMPLGDVMDICALVNNAINFVLYCSMSTKFRQTFLKLYCKCASDYHVSVDIDSNGCGLRDQNEQDSCSNNNQLENVM